MGAGAALVVSGAVANAPTLTTSGTVTINGLGGVTGRSVRTFGGTTVQSGGAVLLAASASSATRTDLVVASLTINAGSKFDIGNGDVDVKTASSAAAATQLAALTAAAAGGFNGGLWTGNGLASTAAAADAKRLTAVGVIQNATAIGGGHADLHQLRRAGRLGRRRAGAGHVLRGREPGRGRERGRLPAGRQRVRDEADRVAEWRL